MSRLPTVGSDSGDWGTVLNDFLGVSLTAAGKLKLEKWADSSARPASPVTYQIGFNIATSKIEQYDGSSWNDLITFFSRPTIFNSSETQQTLTDGATISWDMNLGGYGVVTLGGNRTIANPTNTRNGATYILEIIQDGTGSRTLSWGSNFVWSAATAPALTTTANLRDFITFVCSNSKLYGVSTTNFA